MLGCTVTVARRRLALRQTTCSRNRNIGGALGAPEADGSAQRPCRTQYPRARSRAGLQVISKKFRAGAQGSQVRGPGRRSEKRAWELEMLNGSPGLYRQSTPGRGLGAAEDVVGRFVEHSVGRPLRYRANILLRQHAADLQCVACDRIHALRVATANPHLRDLEHRTDHAGAD